MRLALSAVIAAVLACRRRGPRPSTPCACGKNPPGPPRASFAEALHRRARGSASVLQVHDSLLRVLSGPRSSTTARLATFPIPISKILTEIRIGFLAPLYDHPDQVLGNRMLNGAQMAIDEANAAGGYGGKPFRLVTHNDYDNWQNSSAGSGRRFQRFRHLGRGLERCRPHDL